MPKEILTVDTMGRRLAMHAAEGLFTLKKKPGAGLCLVRGCSKEGHPKKTGLCHGHWQYRWRMRSRKKSAYATLRDHATGRGIEFTISLDYFLGLTDAVMFWDHEAESRGEWLTLDRVDATRGYCPGNLRVISLSHNSVKSCRERHLPEHVQSILERKRARAKENPHLADETGDAESDCPF